MGEPSFEQTLAVSVVRKVRVVLFAFSKESTIPFLILSQALCIVVPIVFGGSWCAGAVSLVLTNRNRFTKSR